MKRVRVRKDNKIGIWINSKVAYVIEMASASQPAVTQINSGIRARIRNAGEEKPFTQYQTTYANEETHKQAKEADLKKKFFRKITLSIHHGDDILILGPGKTKKELHNVINKDHFMEDKIIDAISTRELNKEQAILRVKDYFESEAYRKKKKELRMSGMKING